jgi:hypothetical protein
LSFWYQLALIESGKRRPAEAVEKAAKAGGVHQRGRRLFATLPLYFRYSLVLRARHGVNGRTRCRAFDSSGQTIDFLLTAKRDRAAAKRFLRKSYWRIGQCDAAGDERGQEPGISG